MRQLSKPTPVLVFGTALLLFAAGLLNAFVGFLAIFPGLLEVGLAQPSNDRERPVSLAILATTLYGAFAVAHLLGGLAQLLLANLLAFSRSSPGLFGAMFLAATTLSLLLEVWGWWFKGYLTWFSLPGLTASLACVFLYRATDGTESDGNLT